GLIGMWKAFDEMERLGGIGPARPRMVSGQAARCAPIVRALASGGQAAGPWADPPAHAPGPPGPPARRAFLIPRAVRPGGRGARGGTALAVSDEEMAESVRRIGALEGIFAAPEGGATLAALRRMLDAGEVAPDERVVLFNTGTGLKYTRIER